MNWKSIASPALAALALLAALAISGCGESPAEPPPRAGADAPGAPLLLKRELEPGEIRVAGAVSPRSAGPFAFDGRYKVRFAQYAPEAPRQRFSDQTLFVAHLVSPGGPPRKVIPLFREAAKQGARTITIEGRFLVEVLFGDFPYVVRFTPASG